MKSTVFVILAGLLSTALAQSSWEKVYGGPGYEYASCVRQTSDGGYIAACYTRDTAMSTGDAWLVKTNAYGDTLWTRVYGGPDFDNVYSVRQTSDRGYVLAGSTASYGNGDQAWLVKTDSLGDIVWSKLFGGAGYDVFFSVQPTMDGGYIAAGSTMSFGDSSQVYLVKTNASGDSLWARVYGGTRQDYAMEVQQTTDSGYVVAGGTNSFGNFRQVYVIKTLANGDPDWSKTYGGARWEDGLSVQQTLDGGYVIAGHTNSFADTLRAVYLVKANASGDTLWTRTFGGAGYDLAYSVQQTRDTGYILAGGTESFGDSSQVYLVKTDDSGSELWTRTFGGARHDYGKSVQQTSDSGYVIAGATTSYGGFSQVYLIKTEPDGLVEIEETPRVEVRATNVGPTIVRGVLFLPRDMTESPGNSDRVPRPTLLDAAGRKVADLSPGPNNLSFLCPGVYFARHSARVARIIITR